MIEKIGHIKNPLTVIAIFAAIAEISGTSVLPFIETENQNVYIWFLMIFPVFLVGAFFLTLNFNHRVLYAPSDYEDENNFLQPFEKIPPEAQGEKLLNEAEEVQAERHPKTENPNEPEGQNHAEHQPAQNCHLPPTEMDTRKFRNLMAEVTLAEKLSVNKLSRELDLRFKTDVEIHSPDYKTKAVYDALGIKGNELHAVEIKLFKARNLDLSRFTKTFEQSELLTHHFRGIDPKRFTLHVIAVMDIPGLEMDTLRQKLDTFSQRYKVKSITHVTTLNDLQKEYQYNP